MKLNEKYAKLKISKQLSATAVLLDLA